jgi:rhodanese-related sulfurtransferase
MRALGLALTALCLSTLPGQAWTEENARSKEPTTLYSPAQLVRMVQKQEPVVFLDVREPEEFEKNHIPGAVNMTEKEFAARAHELPSDALVIPYCNMDFRGFTAVEKLREVGVKNVGLMQRRGLEGWRSQNLPVVEKDGITDKDGLAKLMTVDLASLAGLDPLNLVQPTRKVARIHMELSEWYFDPNDLHVKAGDRVEINLTSPKSTKETHFFIMPEFELKEEVRPGETRIISFLADRRGTFRFGSCEWDGEALQVMKGRIAVK